MSDVDEFIWSAALAGAEAMLANFKFLNVLVDENTLTEKLYAAMSNSDIQELEEKFEGFEDSMQDMQDALDHLRHEYERAVKNLNESISSLSEKIDRFEDEMYWRQ